ncbi:MAG: hypothetical protein JRN15_20205 [Nitrososphaerota archaeon]|nr:hypothetical protein [Nitrososphaerota archaeon]
MLNHYFLRASSEFHEVVNGAEKALHNLNFTYLRNMTKELVELEVVNPGYFRIVIEKRRDPEVRNLIIPSIKEAKGTSIDLWFDSNLEENRETIQNSKLFLRALLPLLPVLPWIGLRFRESSKEKKKWQELTG